MKEYDKTLGLVLIAGGNLIPFYGLFAWGWDIFPIFFLYWAENAIIGIYTLIMMLVYNIQHGIFAVIGGLFMMIFFCVHYGIFCLGHIAIITELFGPKMDHHNFQPGDLLPMLLSPQIQGFYWGILGVAVVQAMQCYDAYRLKYSKAKRVDYIMFSPYGRIVLLHISVLIGGLLAQSLGSPVWALAVLMGLKTLYDVTIFMTREEKPDVAPENPENI
jgi:hypothetical protein